MGVERYGFRGGVVPMGDPLGTEMVRRTACHSRRDGVVPGEYRPQAGLANCGHTEDYCEERDQNAKDFSICG